MRINPTTVIEELQKRNLLAQVNTPLLEALKTTPDAVKLIRVEDAEMEEMWSFFASKKQKRWLWHAMYYQTGQLLAYVLTSYQDAVFKQVQSLLAPFGHSTFLYRRFGRV